MKTFERNYLFLVVLGGRAVKANIELHDVRWVVGSKIEDTFNVLRKDWFGIIDGLHIDSFKKIEYIDGYKINLKNSEKNKLKNIYQIEIDYLELRNINNLKISNTNKNSRLFIAYYLNNVRLIDNL